MIPFLVEQFHHNQILQAAVLASPAAMLTYAARSVPMRVWNAVKALGTIELSFNSDMADYHEIVAFVSEHVVVERWSRRLSYHASTQWDRESCQEVAKHQGLRAGYGQHWGWFAGRFVIVDRSMESVAGTEKFKERLHMTFFARGRRIVHRFVDDLRAHVAVGGAEEMVPLFLSDGAWWGAGPKLPLRSIETVFTSHGEGARLLDHIRRFEGERDEYRRRGTPWHTGALLVGEPGTGKTSLIHAIASETRRSIRYLSLGAVEDDRQLVRLIASAPDWRKSLLVIEDADAAGVDVQRERPPPVAIGESDVAAPPEPRTPVTLSALLNALDGLITPDGLVVIATTNHPERLDPALRRPGRFDLTIELGALEWDAFAAMAVLFGHDAGEVAALRRSYRPETGAKLRALLIEDALAAVERHFGQKLSDAA